MALKRSKPGTNDLQLNLFSFNGGSNGNANTTDTIRHDGGEPLARIPSENGSRNGSQRNSQRNAFGSGTQNEGRTLRPDHEVSKAGVDGTTSARPGMGNGEGRIHFTAAGEELVG